VCRTAHLVRTKVGLDVEELLSGSEGRDAQIAARVAEGRIDPGTANLAIASLAPSA
jgi:methylglyoxal synthase